MDERASGPLPVAPSLGPALALAGVPPVPPPPPRRLAALCVLAAGAGVLAALAAVALGRLIALATNLAWHGAWSTAASDPDPTVLGWWSIAVPVAGGLIVGLMARFGSAAIRGHGIPEAMEQVLRNRSRIAPRLVVLKPLSAAIAIGTGGPFGAEGPIIATGGGLGSCLGQVLRVTAQERKTLLAAGAAAGMAATFGTPVSAVLLAIELLLFECRARSFIPVAIAAATAAGMRALAVGAEPVIPVGTLDAPTLLPLLGVCGIGAVAGLVAAAATRAVYGVEDAFACLPLHWMWWPALGGLAVGIAGLIEPRALGIGYGNLADLADGRLLGLAVVSLLAWKAFAWVLALGSGTSGGTLAPLLTIGGCVGALLAGPTHLPLAVAATCGMAAVFAGSSYAVLTASVFVVEATGQVALAPAALLACALSWLIASRLSRHSIMVEKIARRGIAVPGQHDEDAGGEVEAATLRLPRPLSGAQ